MKMQLLWIILHNVTIAFLYIEQAYCVCANAEYEINGHCCPMCAPGNRVLWHCTVDTSTTCVSCSASTYTDEPNGLEMCFSCSTCDAGLRIQKACTRLSNTICEPMKGFFCIAREKGSCTLAVKHSQCNPGEYIQQKGTASTDTVCGECRNGTYSDGTFTACQQHTLCQNMGRKEIETGTMSSDAKCEHNPNVLAGIITGVVVGLIIIGILIKYVIFKINSRARQGIRSVQVQNVGGGLIKYTFITKGST
ncbi:tumor necrosis factor receptor superfamily member 14-like [Puntigrus tetrazona]|uniref:tumor necrosis factor receptor superfamily member 14-like n=1 Tax=Puntigrus tetrazona TaxID=1606681 RepID=UPI001C899C1B|nr:tumor necrosis factor receptor superfamily member 14-like [Puntigrus tetrazona]XP_043102817.1 tumor necrosis factor receptor superfamily member 14-like [Puntigrus tetrazona]